jgi:hypothetical protein
MPRHRRAERETVRWATAGAFDPNFGEPLF